MLRIYSWIIIVGLLFCSCKSQRLFTTKDNISLDYEIFDFEKYKDKFDQYGYISYKFEKNDHVIININSGGIIQDNDGIAINIIYPTPSFYNDYKYFYPDGKIKEKGRLGYTDNSTPPTTTVHTHTFKLTGNIRPQDDWMVYDTTTSKYKFRDKAGTGDLLMIAFKNHLTAEAAAAPAGSPLKDTGRYDNHIKIFTLDYGHEKASGETNFEKNIWFYTQATMQYIKR